jgi:uncharacterized protein YdeI (YjbR/CyaY-like superfamily)
MSTEPVYFETPADLRRWFAAHAASATELIVGFMKMGSGVPSVTWPESVDEALCVGWIDGVRHRIDEARYKIRFTPRKAGSHWSTVNIKRMAELQAAGRLMPAGLAAFERRTEGNSSKAAYEQDGMPEFEPDQLKLFKQDKAAWAYFDALPPGYKKRMVWWVVKAKQEATSQKRLAELIAACADKRRL